MTIYSHILEVCESCCTIVTSTCLLELKKNTKNNKKIKSNKPYDEVLGDGQLLKLEIHLIV